MDVMWNYTEASRSYAIETGGDIVEVHLYDSANYHGFSFFNAWNSAYIEGTKFTEYKSSYSGYPALIMEDWMQILVEDRFLVNVTSLVSITTNREESVAIFANLIDLDGIVALE